MCVNNYKSNEISDDNQPLKFVENIGGARGGGTNESVSSAWALAWHGTS